MEPADFFECVLVGGLMAEGKAAEQRAWPPAAFSRFHSAKSAFFVHLDAAVGGVVCSAAWAFRDVHRERRQIMRK